MSSKTINHAAIFDVGGVVLPQELVTLQRLRRQQITNTIWSSENERTKQKHSTNSTVYTHNLNFIETASLKAQSKCCWLNAAIRHVSEQTVCTNVRPVWRQIFDFGVSNIPSPTAKMQPPLILFPTLLFLLFLTGAPRCLSRKIFVWKNVCRWVVEHFVPKTSLFVSPRIPWRILRCRDAFGRLFSIFTCIYTDHGGGYL